MHEWLTIVTGSEGGPVHFVMSIGGHAIRFCHGTPEDIPRRYREPSFPELVEQQLALELDGDLPTNRALRIVIENDANGRPETICLVEISDTGNATNTYFIPPSSQATVAPFAPSIEPPANIPPVSAEPVGEQQAGAAGASTKTGSGDE